MSPSISIIVGSFIANIEHFIQCLTFIQFIQLFVAFLGLNQILKSTYAFIKAFYSKLYKPGILKQKRYLYHFTRYQDKIELREYELKFEKNWKNRIIIKVNDQSKNKHDYLKYKGCVKNEDGQVVFKLETQNKNYLNEHDKGREEVQIRFYDSSPLTENIVCGLWMGKDLNKHPRCGVRIMSSKKLTESQVKEFITASSITDNVYGMLSIKDIEYVNYQTSKNRKSDLPLVNKIIFKEFNFEELLKDGEYYSGTGKDPLSVEQRNESPVSLKGKFMYWIHKIQEHKIQEIEGIIGIIAVTVMILLLLS